MLIALYREKHSHDLQNLDVKINGAEEDRTPDPLLAKQVLSQLSYSPKFRLNEHFAYPEELGVEFTPLYST